MYNSVFFLFSSNTIYIVSVMFGFVIVLFLANEMNLKSLKKSMNSAKDKYDYITTSLRKAPGPSKKIIVGNLDLLDGYVTPFEAFSLLAKKYGKIFSFQMGSVPALVVNGFENIKEVMLTKSDKYDARPNFQRFLKLFGGDKENSLAFCDWSEAHKAKRDILSSHTFPRKFSFNFNRFSDICSTYLHQLSLDLKVNTSVNSDNGLLIKPFISETCLQVFLDYFSSRAFEKSDSGFKSTLENFDKIFWEVNQGYACDFLPMLMPFYRRKIQELGQYSQSIRKFIDENVIGSRLSLWNEGDEVQDFVDSMIDHVKGRSQPEMDWDMALYAIEDMIGGHAAVANFVVKTLAFLVKNPEQQKKIQSEIDQFLCEKDVKDVTVNDRNVLIYTEAVILESLRLISSPIVPHVASADTSVSDFAVSEGTLIFLNNYDLNMSSELWTEPEKFDPSRFIVNDRIVKPEYFIPFGFGRRSCMGYKIVHMLSFVLIANILKEFDIKPINNDEITVTAGSLAVKDESYKFSLSLRN